MIRYVYWHIPEMQLNTQTMSSIPYIKGLVKWLLWRLRS